LDRPQFFFTFLVRHIRDFAGVLSLHHRAPADLTPAASHGLYNRDRSLSGERPSGLHILTECTLALAL
jgi:hypothetical protein